MKYSFKVYDELEDFTLECSFQAETLTDVIEKLSMFLKGTGFDGILVDQTLNHD